MTSTITTRTLGLIGAALALAAAGCSARSAPLTSGAQTTAPPTRTAVATASPIPTAEQAAVLTAFSSYVSTFAAMANQAVQRTGWDQVAVDPAYTQGLTTIAQLRQAAEYIPGSPSVTGKKITALSADSATLTACWSTKGFRPVHDGSKTPVAAAVPSPQVVTVTLTYSDALWRVSDLADAGPTCTG